MTTETIRNPCWRMHLSVTVVPPRDILVVDDQREVMLGGELFAGIAPFLDGRAMADVVAAVLDAGAGTEDEVHAAVAILRDRGYVTERGEDPAALAAHRHRWNAPADTSDRLRAATVGLVALGDVPIDAVHRTLAELGPTVEAVTGPPIDGEVAWNAAVVLADDYLHPDLNAWNEALLAASVPWLLARPTGARLWLGPLVEPGSTACWACLEQRLRFNRQVELRFAERSGADRVPPAGRGWSAGSAAGVAGQIAAVLERRLVDGSHPLAGMVRIAEPDAGLHRGPEGEASGTTEWHRVVRRPQCRACGDPDPWPKLTEPPALGSHVEHGRQGPYATGAAEQTLERYAYHVSPVSGVVARIADVATGADDRLLVSEAGVNLARRAGPGRADGFRERCAGKGVTRAQARAGALAEALERYSSFWNGEEPSRLASFDELGDAAIDPHAVLGFSDAQYAQREQWNATHMSGHRIPVRFDEEARAEQIAWSPLWSLTRGERRWLPTAYSYYSARVPGGRYVHSDSNGNAAGATPVDAVVQGLLELIERDAVGQWWYNRFQAPAVDLDAFDDGSLRNLLDGYTALGRDVWALDVTTDLGVPVVAAVSTIDGRAVTMGLGAHVDPLVATLRAVTEMNQMLAMFRGTAGPSAPEEPEWPDNWTRPAQWWAARAATADLPWLTPAPGGPVRPAAVEAGDDVADRLAELQRRIEAAGLELCVQDHTRADIALPVMKVVVPGLRFFWPRYAPGRLYDVPVVTGRLAAPRTEAELNPIPLFW